MALTADIFKQIVKNLKSDHGQRYNELRNRPRVGVHGKVDIKPLPAVPGKAGQFSVWVRDLSMDGIGILHSTTFAAKSQFVAYFPRAEGEPMAVTYIVAYTKQVSKGLYVIGARLGAVGEGKIAAA